MVHLILKQVLFILGVSEPTDISENKQLFLNLMLKTTILGCEKQTTVYQLIHTKTG